MNIGSKLADLLPAKLNQRVRVKAGRSARIAAAFQQQRPARRAAQRLP